MITKISVKKESTKKSIKIKSTNKLYIQNMTEISHEKEIISIIF